jgi:hypothetical protein
MLWRTQARTMGSGKRTVAIRLIAVRAAARAPISMRLLSLAGHFEFLLCAKVSSLLSLSRGAQLPVPDETLDAANRADSRQADYYRRIFDARQKHLHRRLVRADSRLTKARLSQDSRTAQRLQMLIRELKAERHEIYRLTTALDFRFPPSVVGVNQRQGPGCR